MENIDKFVIEQLPNLRKIFFQESEFGKFSIREECWTKWNNLIESFLMNHTIPYSYESKMILVVYAELYCLFNRSDYAEVSETSETLETWPPRWFSQFLKKIEEKKNIPTRSKIIGKWYNYKRDLFEYELEDGNFVPLENHQREKKTHKLEIEDLPLCLRILFDPEKYRHDKLNEILDDNRE